MSKAEQDRSNRRKSNFAEIIESLDSGESFIEDYPEELIRKLETFLAKKSKSRRQQ
jgi:hypothetical protein